VSLVCSSCGHESAEAFKFCPECGAPAAAAAAAREARKLVTVLFADVVGSTAFGESRDPEAVRAHMARWFEEARRVLERHGGHVEKFVGDAVMAVFGIPRAHEDDALRAVRAAAELRSDGLRIGVNTGTVVAGEGETLVTGDAVNVAARIEQAARPGEVLLGAETRRLVRDAAAVQLVAPLDLKGKSAAVEAYRLISLDPEAAGVARHLESPLVGRKRELERLRQDYERAVEEPSCHLFTLLGSAGVGKSRLVAEFLADVRGRVVTGRCLHYGDGITYFPVVEVVIQLGAEPESILASSPAETQLAFRKLLEREAAEQPLVVVFEDLHWAEPTCLDLVEHVADLSRDAPILLVCIARPELLDVRRTWGGGKFRATTILLEPLAAAECDELIELLGGADDETRTRIITAAEGNPLFVEEMIAMLADGGGDTVPATIQALLQARLDLLGRDERAVIERGAVEGQVFHRGAIAELAPETDVDAQLPTLIRKELIRPDASMLPQDEAYRFRHLLIRDAAYEALPKQTRADLHERFAEWLDAHAQVLEQDEIVGYHLEQAARYREELGRPDAGAARRAAERLAAAGRAARDRGDSAALLTLIGRAESLLPEADLFRLELLFDLTRPLVLAGRFEEATAAIETLKSQGDDRLQARARLAEVELTGVATSDLEAQAARRAVEEAMAILTRHGDEEGLAYGCLVATMVEWFAIQLGTCERMIDQGLAHAGRAGSRWLETEMLAQLPAACSTGPLPLSRAVRELELLRPRAEGRPTLSAAVQRALGRCAAMRGDFAAGKRQVAASLATLEELGTDVLTIASHGMTLAELAWLEGDAEAEERHTRDAYERLAEFDERGHRSTLALFLAEIVVRLGRNDEGEELIEETRRLTSPADVVNHVGADAVSALLLARRGEHDAAVTLARHALDGALATDSFAMRTWVPQITAEAMEAAQRPTDAAAIWEVMLAESLAKECVPLAERARERLAQLEVVL
jgi:class 3 adenylate cyclase